MARRYVQPTYFQLSRSPQYSLAFAMPLLMAYEGFAFLLNHSDLYGIRNSADVFLKLFLAYVGIHGFFGFGAAMILALLLFRVMGGGPRFGSIRLGVLVWMLAESLVYSVVFGALVSAVTSLLLAQHRLLHLQQLVAYGIAAGLGALLFAAFHYIGPFGDPLQLPSFVFRFIAGLILTGLYFARGYGITAYTHSLYDLWITFEVI